MEKDRELVISLAAVVFTIDRDEPRILTLPGPSGESLPFGIFSPTRHRTLEEGLREWVQAQTGIELHFAEQLYTFGNLYRDSEARDPGQRLLTIAYWAFSSHASLGTGFGATWTGWYEYFPWEDRRKGSDQLLEEIREKLAFWVDEAENGTTRRERQDRVRIAFGPGDWDDERVLPRYELLYEAGLVCESPRDWLAWPPELRTELPISRKDPSAPRLCFGNDRPMIHDHRRILASAVGRLRGKMKYRPILFQLMPPEFTLGHLQRVTEACSGTLLHKQNFRRTLLSGEFVEETGGVDKSGPGRPASLYRFRAESLLERRAPWLGLPQKKS